MRKRFKDAIHGAGGLARPAADKTQVFAASIQPLGFEGNGHSGLGEGFLKSYKLFAEHSPVTQKLKEGDMIIFDNRAYVIKAVTTELFAGKSLYLRGILTLCGEGDA